MSDGTRGAFGSIGMGFMRGIGLSLALFVLPAILGTVLIYFLVGHGDDEGSEIDVKSKHAVGVVNLEGEIVEAEKFRKNLQKLVKNDHIRAIVVRIDSPGGGVGASEEIYNHIKNASKEKPVVCSLGSLAASGGLYSAMGCQKVVTFNGTLTGSIGVIVMSPAFYQVLDKIGVSMNVVKSGRYKDVGSPFREMNEEDRSLMQGLIDTSYAQFVHVVATARNLPEEEVRKFADGRIILGEQAVKLGLADEVGGMDRAAKIALEMSGDNADPEIIYPDKKTGLARLFDSEEYEDLMPVRLFRTVTEVRVLYRAFL